jgi:excisionase family DNA binding protein
MSERPSLMTAREAADYMRISLFTLSKIEKRGELVPFRTPGGHRRYSVGMLNEYLENTRNRALRQSSAAAVAD